MNESQQNIKGKVVKSVGWKFVERVSVQGMQFVIQLVLARILLPKDYGVVALLLSFTVFANIIINGGFSSAVIQTDTMTDNDYKSVLTVNFVISLVVYMFLFIISPLIENYIDVMDFAIYLRFFALGIVFGSINSIQQSKLLRGFRFNIVFLTSLCATVISGVVGIVLALSGFGVWALIIQQIILQFLFAIFNSLVSKIGFTSKIKGKKVLELLNFGWKVQVGLFIEAIYTEIRSWSLARRFSTDTLGYYNRGKQFPLLISNTINGSVKSVIFVSFSQMKNENELLLSSVRRSIRYITVLIFPAMFGLIAISNELVVLLLTDKWLDSIVYLQVIAIGYMFLPINTTYTQLMNGKGRSDLYLIVRFVNSVISIALLFIALQFDSTLVAWSFVISTLIFVIINSIIIRQIIGYNLGVQIKDLYPQFLSALIMYFVISFILPEIDSYFILLTIKSVIGFLSFSISMYVIDKKIVIEIIEMIRSLLKKK